MIRKYVVKVGNDKFEVEVEELQPAGGPESYSRMQMPQVVTSALPSPRPVATGSSPAPKAAAGDGKGIQAVMSGTVLALLVAPGDAVKEGDAVLKLEAMKMETVVSSTADGKVKAIHVKQGQAVSAGDLLVELE